MVRILLVIFLQIQLKYFGSRHLKESGFFLQIHLKYFGSRHLRESQVSLGKVSFVFLLVPDDHLGLVPDERKGNDYLIVNRVQG